MPRERRKFAEVLSNPLASEFSSSNSSICSSSDSETYEPPNRSKHKDLNYVKEVVEDADPVAQ